MKLIPTLLCDFYKLSHREQYPEGTEEVYSTWTPRSGKHLPDVKDVVVYGHQGFVKEFLIDFFNENFFNKQLEQVVKDYKRTVKNCLFIEEPYTKHIEDLHSLGYLPLEILSLEEGMTVPFRTPILTVRNTNPKFFWLTNYIETVMSNNLWKPATTASIAKVYRDILNSNALLTTGSIDGVEFQGHDFSMRGMSGVEDSARSGSGHLLFFKGTDTIPAIHYLEQYYNADMEKELIGCSVNATEHSVMSSGTKENERETYRRLIEDVYPSGIVSIVSDTWDLWNVITNILPSLKDSILKRTGSPLNKVVIRPDSGNPVDILCGDNSKPKDTPAYKGVVELLYDLFGGTITDQGFKVLNGKIGTIYGDAITPATCRLICDRLKDKGFATTNVIYGIGSFTYQHLTRDSLGFAMKATSVSIKGKQIDIFKDPITDDGTKKSAIGKVSVYKDNNTIKYADSNNPLPNDKVNLLKPIFLNGKLMNDTSLKNIRCLCEEGLTN